MIVGANQWTCRDWAISMDLKAGRASREGNGNKAEDVAVYGSQVDRDGECEKNTIHTSYSLARGQPSTVLITARLRQCRGQRTTTGCEPRA